MHICTINSFRAGIDEPPIKCFVCGHKTMFMDWVGFVCDTCGADTAREGQGGFMRAIREKTGMTRKQFAERIGYKQSTIKSYEWNHPSKKYYDNFNEFIRGFYS